MNAEKPQIGGWLHLVRILLWIGMIVGPIASLGSILELVHQHDFLAYFKSFDELTGTVFAYFLYSLFKKRRRAFVKWSIIYEVISKVAKCSGGFTVGKGRDLIFISIGVCIAVIYIAYLLRSKRVKDTFIF